MVWVEERPSVSVTVREISCVPDISNLYEAGFFFSMILSGNVHLYVSVSSSGSYESEPSRFMENGISFSSLPFWMVIFAMGAEFV